MDKMAIFVEGQTEQIFAERLIRAVAGDRHVHVDTVQAFGGATSGMAGPRVWVEVEATKPDVGKKYYVIIYDCMGDSRVLSDIAENYDNLVSQQFKEIIGIRDVKPRSAADIPTIRIDFETYLPKKPIQPLLVLAIMEIEAWFIAEHTHFPRFHPRLTDAVVSTTLGYDPSTHDIESVLSPVDNLRSVYGLVGRPYSKDKKRVERTIRFLAYERFYLELIHRFADLANLIAHLNAFLA